MIRDRLNRQSVLHGGRSVDNNSEERKKNQYFPEPINFSRNTECMIGIKFNFSTFRFPIVIIFHWLYFEVSFLETRYLLFSLLTKH